MLYARDRKATTHYSRLENESEIVTATLMGTYGIDPLFHHWMTGLDNVFWFFDRIRLAANAPGSKS